MKSFPNPRHFDSHLDQTKFNDLLFLTIDGVLMAHIQWYRVPEYTLIALNCPERQKMTHEELGRPHMS